MSVTKERDQFGASELAICLSHYDLGIISRIEEFPRGSRRAPKIVIDCQRGRFLFKRRARGKDDLAKVAFTHQIQLTLAGQNYPLPHLLGTRDENNSLLLHGGNIYEMFEYIEGGNYEFAEGTAPGMQGRRRCRRGAGGRGISISADGTGAPAERQTRSTMEAVCRPPANPAVEPPHNT